MNLRKPMVYFRTAKYGVFSLVMLASCNSAFGVDCSKAITTPDMNECASIEQKQVEATLNKVCQRVLKSLGGRDGAAQAELKTRDAFIAAQRAWIRFREADCNAVYQKHADGSIRTLMYIGCMQNHAERRIKDLEYFESE